MREAAVRVTIPRADALMTAVLMVLMFVADVGAMAFFDVHQARNWPTLIIMPGTLFLIWLSYAGTILIMARRPGWNTSLAGPTAARMMGAALVVVGITLTVTHAGLLAYGTRLIGPQDMQTVFRLFGVAFGLNLAFVANMMAKRMNPSRMPVVGNPRAMGWVGVLSGVAVAIAAVTVPFEQLTAVQITLSMIPCVFNIASMLAHRLERRRTD